MHICFVWETIKMIVFLLFHFVLFTHGFLLNNTGDTRRNIQESHHLLILDLLSVERQSMQTVKQALAQMKTAVIHLQNQVKGNLGEISSFKSNLSIVEATCETNLKYETDSLKEIVSQLQSSQQTMITKVEELEKQLKNSQMTNMKSKVDDFEGQLKNSQETMISKVEELERLQNISQETLIRKTKKIERQLKNSQKVMISKVVDLVNKLADSQETLRSKVEDLEKQLTPITETNVKIRQDFVVFQNELDELKNQTFRVKESLDAFSHQNDDFQNLTKIEDAISIILNQQIGTFDSKYALLSLGSNSTKQDVVDLQNRNSLAHQKIDALTNKFSIFENITDKQSLHVSDLLSKDSELQKAIEKLDLISETLQSNQTKIGNRLFNLSAQVLIGQQPKVILTAYGPNEAPTYNAGTTIKFPMMMTERGVRRTHLDNFKRTGKFTCTDSGVYLFSVSIMSPTSGAHCEIKRNDKHVLYIYVNGISGGSKDYHTASQTITFYLEPEDTVYVSAYSKMVVHSDYSSFTIIKIQ